MKTKLKNRLFLVVLYTSVLSLPACTDWTEPESLTLHNTSFEEQNPQLYQDYLQDLRNYKAGDHKIMLVSFDNPVNNPTKQAEHLTILPDSVDFINLNNPDNLNVEIMVEMEEIRNSKGTKTLYTISHDAFETAWIAKQKEEGGEALTEEDALNYLGECTDKALSLCDKYNYDGIIVEYTGRSLVSMTEEVLAEYNARQRNFFNRITEWKQKNTSKSLLLYGNVQYWVPENMSMLSNYDYIILKSLGSTNADDLSVKAYLAVQAGLDAVAGQDGGVTPVPVDRFIACVETPRPEDKEQTYGYWSTVDAGGNKTLATCGAAQWAVVSSVDFVRKGIYIQNAHNDYYDNAIVYQHIRESIQIMNPNK